MVGILDELKTAVGHENVSVDPAELEKYSRDQSFVRPRRPDFVVFVRSIEEFQEIVKIANKHRVPIVPYSSGQTLRGATIPYYGGIMLNMSRMNRVEVDERNWFAVIEPGVTYGQLQDELEKHGLRVMAPLGVPPTRSALTSLVERDPALASASFEYGNDLLMDTEIVLPSGKIFRTGKWSGGGTPGSPMGPAQYVAYRFWTGAQGAFGILSKVVVKVECLPKQRKVFFIPFDRLEDAMDPIRRIQRREIGLECFALNKFNLAALLCGDWTIPSEFPCKRVESAEFEALRMRMPNWTFVICLTGFTHLPEEKVKYEEEDLLDVCAEVNVELKSTVAGVLGLEEVMLAELLRPWGILKKFRYRGSCHDVSFYTKLRRVPEFEGVVRDLAEEHGYPTKDIGGYVLPIERGRAWYCEYDFHCDRTIPEESEMVKRLWLKTIQTLIDKGALLTKLYGPRAEIYRKTDPAYVESLKRLKRELDPNNIMNPGKLCF